MEFLKNLNFKDFTIGTWFNIIMVVLVLKLTVDLGLFDVLVGGGA